MCCCLWVVAEGNLMHDSLAAENSVGIDVDLLARSSGSADSLPLL